MTWSLVMHPSLGSHFSAVPQRNKLRCRYLFGLPSASIAMV
jgi:hypothetical protein